MYAALPRHFADVSGSGQLSGQSPGRVAGSLTPGRPPAAAARPAAGPDARRDSGSAGGIMNPGPGRFRLGWPVATAETLWQAALPESESLAGLALA